MKTKKKKFRYSMWAAPVNPKYLEYMYRFIEGKTKPREKPPVPDAWYGIVDNQTTKIDGSPKIDQYICLCPSAEKQREVWEILNGIKKEETL